jgi:hypothetical protein
MSNTIFPCGNKMTLKTRRCSRELPASNRREKRHFATFGQFCIPFTNHIHVKKQHLLRNKPATIGTKQNPQYNQNFHSLANATTVTIATIQSTGTRHAPLHPD